MLNLFGHLRKRERLLTMICFLLVLGQCGLDWKLFDQIKDLTIMMLTPDHLPEELLDVGIRMAHCVLGSAVFALAGNRFAVRVAAGFGYTMREKVFCKAVDLEKSHREHFSISDLIHRTTDDVENIQTFLRMNLPILLRMPVMVVWLLVRNTGTGWKWPAAFGLGILLIALKVIFSETRRFRYRRFVINIPMMQLAMNLIVFMIYWLAACLIQNIPAADMTGRIGMLGDMTAFSVFVLYMITWLIMLAKSFQQFSAVHMSFGRLQELLAVPRTMEYGQREKGVEQGTVEFRNVSFRYAEAEPPVLENICFRAMKGQTVAIVGAAGSEETILAELAVRLYDPTEGQVLVDGVDVREYTFEALYDKLGYVPQHPAVFSGSLRSNVCFGESAALGTAADVRQALNLAQAQALIGELPDGLLSKLSQRGENLSTPQRAQLSLARALARKPEILIVDDCFWARDYKFSWEEFSEALGDVTLLLLARNVEAVRSADHILVLEHGKLAGQGSHRELMQNCEAYRQIVAAQMLSTKEKQAIDDLQKNTTPLRRDFRSQQSTLLTGARLSMVSVLFAVLAPAQIAKTIQCIQLGLMDVVNLVEIYGIGLRLVVFFLIAALCSQGRRAVRSCTVLRTTERLQTEAAICLLGYLVMMLITQWQIGSAVAGIVVLGSLRMVLRDVRSRQSFRLQKKMTDDLKRYVEEIYCGQDVVRLSRASRQVKERFRELNGMVYAASRRMRTQPERMLFRMEFMRNIFYMVIGICGSLLVQKGACSMNMVVAFFLYGWLVAVSLVQLMQMNLPVGTTALCSIFRRREMRTVHKLNNN